MGIRQLIFGKALEKMIIFLLIIFLLISFVIIIKNKINITEKEGLNLYIKSLGEFGKNSIKNLVKITSFVIKQDWIPDVKNSSIDGESNVNHTNNLSNK
ncbi:MAG: hypothetical protein QW622_02025 [Candidatus Pacearchaeota archaeon]